jgi:hypothetical protein
MKHLKAYKLFESESVDEVEKEIKDILWPILSNGYIIHIDKRCFPQRSSSFHEDLFPNRFKLGEIKEIIEIFISKPGVPAKEKSLDEDVISAIQHLLSYTEAMGFKCHQGTSEFRFNLYGGGSKTIESMKELEANINSPLKIENIHFEFCRSRKKPSY